MPSLIKSLVSLWPPMWSKVKATAHTLPYEAALIDRYVRGRQPEHEDERARVGAG